MDANTSAFLQLAFTLKEALFVKKQDVKKSSKKYCYSNFKVSSVYTEKIHTLVCSPCHRKRSKRSTEVKLGATISSMFWGEEAVIETTTSMDILVLNYVEYTQYFQYANVFLEKSGAMIPSEGRMTKC